MPARLPLLAAVAVLALSLALPAAPSGDAAAVRRVSDADPAAAPAQALTATPTPAPADLAAAGYWRRKGRETASMRLCVVGDGYRQVLRVCVTNHGERPSGPFTIAADRWPDVPLAATGGLLPGETLCLPLDVPADVGVVVDPDDRIDEPDEADNWIPAVPVPTLPAVALPTCAPAGPTPLAELDGAGFVGLITPLGCWRPDVDEGRSTLTIANSGDVDAGAFRVAGPGEGPEAPGWPVPDLPVDGARWLVNGYFATHSVIDPDGRVPERDRSNNDIYVPIPTAPPTCPPGFDTPTPRPAPRLELTAWYSHVGPRETCVRGPIMRQVYGVVRNTGNAAAYAVDVETDQRGVAWRFDVLEPGAYAEFGPACCPRYVGFGARWSDYAPVRSVRLWGGEPTPAFTAPPPCTPDPRSTPSAMPTRLPTPSVTPAPLPNLYGRGSSTVLEDGLPCLRSSPACAGRRTSSS
ncbi:MAG: hypothetical protein U0470_03005 [Anaerolineae bacterium]